MILQTRGAARPAVGVRQAGGRGVTRRGTCAEGVGGCRLRPVKVLVATGLLLAFSAVALADAPKNAPIPKKLPREERVYVMDKDAPSLDKTLPLVHARIASKNK